MGGSVGPSAETWTFLGPVRHRRIAVVRTLSPNWRNSPLRFQATDLPPRVVPHPMLVPAPVEGREGRASSGTRATA